MTSHYVERRWCSLDLRAYYMLRITQQRDYIQPQTGSRVPMKCAHAYQRISVLFIFGGNDLFRIYQSVLIFGH